MTELAACQNSSLGVNQCLSNDILGYFEDQGIARMYGWLAFDMSADTLIQSECLSLVTGFSVSLQDFMSAFVDSFGSLAPPA